MKKCKCGSELKYEDNSILQIGNKEIYGLYHCKNCKMIYDAEILDCNHEYMEVNQSKYENWFSYEYQLKKQEKLIRFYEGLLSPLGYLEEDKEK